MTVEAVPRVDENGKPVPQEARKLMNTTMQTLGRVALISGLALVAGINLYLFADVERLSEAQKVAVYRQIYLTALAIPFISVLGVTLALFLKRRAIQRLVDQGMDLVEAREAFAGPEDRPAPNWWILGGSLGFVAFTLGMGFSRIELNQEIIFAGSFAIIAFLIAKLTRVLEPEARATLIGTAIVIFVYRAIPGHRRRGGCALHRGGEYGARVSPRPDRDDPDARLDRELGPAEPEGHLLRHHGLVHQPRPVRIPARHEVPQPGVRRDPGDQGRRQRRRTESRRLRPAGG